MKKILLIIIMFLFTGCAGIVVSPEQTKLKNNFSISNVNQSELFDMCIDWIVMPRIVSTGLTIDNSDKDNGIIQGTGTFYTLGGDILINSSKIIEFQFKINITGNSVNIIYTDYVFLEGMGLKKKPFRSNYLKVTTAYLEGYTKALESGIKNKVASKN